MMKWPFSVLSCPHVVPSVAEFPFHPAPLLLPPLHCCVVALVTPLLHSMLGGLRNHRPDVFAPGPRLGSGVGIARPNDAFSR